MTTATQVDNSNDEIAKESIKSVTDVFNKGIAGNPLAFVSVLIIIILSLLLLGVFGSNLYFQFQNMETQQDSTAKISKNNELLQQLIEVNRKQTELLQRILDSNKELSLNLKYGKK